MEILEEFSWSTATKDREKDMRIQELSSQWEVERHNLQDLFHKYNEVVIKHINELERVKVLLNEKNSLEQEKIYLAKVISSRIASSDN